MTDRRQGQRGTGPRLRRSLLVAAVATVGALAAPGAASAVDPPTCSSLGYSTPFLIIDGKSVVVGTTRWIEMRENPRSTNNLNAQSTPEQPFPLTIDMSYSAPRTYTVRNYARNQFPARFHRGETALVTAKYVEQHTEQSRLLGTVRVRCTRTVTAHFNRPKPRPTGGGGGGGGDDGEDDDNG